MNVHLEICMQVKIKEQSQNWKDPWKNTSKLTLQVFVPSILKRKKIETFYEVVGNVSLIYSVQSLFKLLKELRIVDSLHIHYVADIFMT